MRNSVNSNMLQALKSFQCPSCHKSFTNKDPGRFNNISRFPLILKCGHTVCELCLHNYIKIEKKKKISCPVCKDCTEFPNGDLSKLVPDMYVLGLVTANLKHGVPSVKMKPVTSPVVPNLNSASGKLALVVCDICSAKEASFRCDKCEDNFCNTCFDTSHKSRGKSLQKHIGIPVYSSVYRTMVQGGCSEHEGKSIEFFCEEDKELLCSLCVVTGSHREHDVSTLVDKNKVCAEGLKKAREEAALTNKRLIFTEHKISQIIPGENVDCSEHIKQIREHFHLLHATLLLRENELIAQLETISQTNVTHLEKLRQEISDTYKDINSAIRDAELVLENPAVSISVPALVQKLESAEKIPCHLCPSDESGDEKNINILFEPTLLETIRQHGNIEGEIKLKYCLKSTDQLPDGFVPESIPEESVPTDTESISSDSMSEDSLNTVNGSTLAHPIKLKYYASMQEKVQVSCVQDPSCFYVVRSSEVRKLKTLEEKMNRWCRTNAANKQIPSTLKEGDMYLVRYAEDNKWYRGRVLSLESLESTTPGTKTDKVSPSQKREQRAKIFYVDFGNTEVVPISRLRNMQTQFLNLPGMAKKCSLHGIVPVDSKWSDECIKVFRNFVQSKEVNMQVVEEREGVLYADLSQGASAEVTNDVPVSVRDALVFLEFGCFTEGTKNKIAKRMRSLKTFHPPEEICANVKTNVLVSHVESPSRFYVQQLATSRHLSDLILEMKAFYENETNILHSVYVPYIGMMCAARYSKDQFWYRAEVINLPGGARVEVRYVDFGNSEVIHHRNIRKLMDRFSKLSTQATQCCLADVSPPNQSVWPKQATAWLTNFVDKKHLTLLSLGVIPTNKVTKAILYYMQPDINSELCVNALMVKGGFADSIGPYSKVTCLPKGPAKHTPKIKSPIPVPPAPKDIIVTRTESESSSSSVSSPPLVAEVPSFEESLVSKAEPENSVKVHVSHVESPGCFYVRIANETEEKFNRLMKALQDVYTESDFIPEAININCSYIVFRQFDQKWYRGLVQEKIGDVYKVHFVDYGFVEEVAFKDFRIIEKQHGIEQSFAVECYLADILPAGDSSKWPQAAIAAFRELVKPHEVLYLVGKVKRENSLASDLFYKEVLRGGALEPSKVQFFSISEKLLEMGVVLKARNTREKPAKTKQEEPLMPPSPSSSVNSTESARTACDSPCTVIMAPISPRKIPTPVENVEQSTALLVSSKSITATREPVFMWLPPTFPSEKKFLCQVTYVADDGGIYLQQKPESTSKVSLLTSTFQCMYKAAEPEKLRLPPPVGEAVMARFKLDKKWYRAEVISDNPSKIKVQFVDFGNCEIVELDDLRVNIPMKDKPRFALECELYDTMPAEGDTWPVDVLDFLHESLVEQDCFCEVMETPVEGEKLKISLTLKESEADICILLREMGKAVSVEQYKIRKEERMKIKSPVELERTQIGYSNRNRLPLSRLFPVCITQMLEPNVIYLQWLKIENPSCEEDEIHNVEIDQFLDLVQDLSATAEEMPPVTNPVQGLACCAKFTADDNWYRCEIVRVSPKGVYVCYVDYGNSEQVPLDSLRKPTPRFLEFPVQAHLCKMRGLDPVGKDWPAEVATALLEKYQSGAEIYAKIIVPGDVNEIELFAKAEDGSMELLYKDLIEKGLVSYAPH